jgi:beta-galactosidase
MFFLRRLSSLLVYLCAWQVLGRAVKRDPLPGVVEWDEHSLIVRGERIMLFNGEFHPFRLPVPDLWLDVFQKLKSAGFSGVSFYTDWVSLAGL